MSVIVKSGGGAAKQEKTVTAGTYVKEVLPDTGKLLSRVVVNPTPTEEKTVTPTTSKQTVSPSEGKHLAKVIINAMEDVTPEVTAQTPLIKEIAEKFGVSIATPSGTNKQILQGNNTNLQSIKTNAPSVTIDGVQYKEDLNLQSEFLNLNTQYENLPITLLMHNAEVIDEKINILRNTDHYVFENDSWVKESTPPESLNIIFTHNNKLHGVCGNSGKIYFYENGSWTLLTTLPNKNPEFVVSCKGYIYMIGCSINSTYMAKFNGSSWTQLSNLPLVFSNVTVYNNEIHMWRYYNSCIYYIYNGEGTSSRALSNQPFASGETPVFGEFIGKLYGAWNKSLYLFKNDNWEQISGITLPCTSIKNLVGCKNAFHSLDSSATNYAQTHYNIYSKYYREV